jgi:hypothetical protein
VTDDYVRSMNAQGEVLNSSTTFIRLLLCTLLVKSTTGVMLKPRGMVDIWHYVPLLVSSYISVIF